MQTISNIRQTFREMEDFGHSNLALIAGTGFLLLVLAFTQKPFTIARIGDKPPAKPQTIAYAPAGATKSLAQASVLGATTVNADLLSTFSDVKVNTTEDNSSAAIQTYNDQLAIVKDSFNVDSLLIAKTNADIQAREKTFIDSLGKISVPSDLADYHRMYVGYFVLNFSKQAGANGAAVDDLITQVHNELKNVRDSVQSKTSIALPTR